MDWTDQLKGDPLTGLFESNLANIRYLAQRDLLDASPGDARLLSDRQEAHTSGPIQDILNAMQPEGFWVKPGAGYNPKYRATVWSLILLSQLGASVEEDARIQQACLYLLDHALSRGGKFSYNGPPSGTIDCLQGNLCWALTRLGCNDERLVGAYDWLARSVTGEGIAPRQETSAPERYYSAKSGPLFECGANGYTSCAWGAVKVMLALSLVPPEIRNATMKQAVRLGLDFLLGIDPATAAYPSPSGKPNLSWWKFGFPVFYVTDLLQLAEALLAFLPGNDPRLSNLLVLIREKQDVDGFWPMEYSLTGKTWVDFGPKGKPNPWVTLRALRVFKMAGSPSRPGL